MSEDTERTVSPSAPPGNVPGQRTARQRRPTGAPPPLPHPVKVSTTAWLVLAVVIVSCAFLISAHTPWLGLGDRTNTRFLRMLAEVRTPWLTDVARAIKAAGSGWGVTVLGLSVVALTMIFRRWRHLLVFVGGLFFLELVGQQIYFGLSRPRPYGISIISGWGGYSAPSPPVLVLTVFLLGAVYCLVVPGRPRTWAKAVVTAVVALFCLARLYLAVDHPDDVLFAVALGVAIPVTAFRWFTPNEVFPVVYRRGRTAHVDVSGKRGDAIRRAISDQLGLTVLEVKPIGLESSAGSTPQRLRVEGGPDEYVFAKLYTKGHVRADRWYKLSRTIMYGSLEDEQPFQTVRRLAEYEDYALRLLRDAGVRTARPYGIVEITPEREYMVVTEFFDGAVEIGRADVGDDVIDQGLRLIRRLWDAGIAHRDIKPGNLMVRDGELLLIDAGFAQVRPSPWRQAVDLGNMMLVLAVRTDPERVYQRALRYFTPDELSEAFAATRGVASPTQLRAFMKRDPRDLLSEFRALAPPRKPIALQRWSVRRVGLAFAMFGGIALAILVGVQAFLPSANAGAYPPQCGTGHTMILAAQAVPSAKLVPCISALPAGWQVGGADIASGHARFWLNSDQAGDMAVTITLSAACDTSGARQIPSDQPGTQRFERPLSLRPQFTGLRFYTFPGGCATYKFNFAAGKSPLLAIPVDSAVAFTPRAKLVDYIRSTEGLALCAMPGMSRPAAAKREEHLLLAYPGRDIAVTTITVVVTAAIFGAVASQGVLAHIQHLDNAWLRLMVSNRSAPVTAFAKFLNFLGLVYITLPVRIAIAGFLALRRRWCQLAAFVTAIVASEALIGTLKGIYGRARPLHSLVATSGASFPSGHSIAATVTVVAAVIALVPPGRRRAWWGAGAVAFSVLMALSRAYLAAHWLSDAIAGVLLGTSCALLAALVVGLLQRRWRDHHPGPAAHGPAAPDVTQPADKR